jgi:hypothetical protein
MPTPVNNTPTGFQLEAVQVGNPVSSAHLLRLAEECSFNGGYNLHCVCDFNLKARNTARVAVSALGAFSLPFVYYRSPGAQVLAVVVTLAAGYGTTSSVGLNMTLPSGASWLVANGLDGSAPSPFRYPPVGRVNQTEIIGFMRVDSCSVATILHGSLDVTMTAAVSQSINRFRVFEVPLATIDPTGDPTAPALEQASQLSPNRIVDGGSTSPRGLKRLAYLMDTYRTKFSKHVALVGLESTNNAGATTNPHWHRDTTSYGALEWQYDINASHDPHFKFENRDLYQDGANTTWQLHCRYKTSSNTLDSSLRAYINGIGGTTQGAQTMNLPHTNNVWTWATAKAVTVPTDGTRNLCELYFDAKSGTSGAGGAGLQISNLTLVEAP